MPCVKQGYTGGYLWVSNQFTPSWVGNTKCVRNVLARPGIEPRTSVLTVQRFTTTLPLHPKPLMVPGNTTWTAVANSVNQDQIAQNMHTDLVLHDSIHCSMKRFFFFFFRQKRQISQFFSVKNNFKYMKQNMSEQHYYSRFIKSG